MGLPKECEITLRHRFRKGEKNLITDVPQVKVANVTIENQEKGVHTGVTAILPHGDNLFREKVAAGSYVINGFGKSAGLIQIDELGTIESPIIMTNTLSVGTALTATVKYMLNQCEEIGVTAGTVNCVVTECNDGALNDIRGLYVKEEHVIEAISNAEAVFEEGNVGGGCGMTCMGLKGGIGSASRIVTCDGKDYTIGAIVMSNFGNRGYLRIDGFPAEFEKWQQQTEKGSIIVVIATDIPLSDRQLRRVSKRAVVGITRTGSYLGNGSGDIAIAFSTGNKIPHKSEKQILDVKMFHDSQIDTIFEATAEAVEEAILSSLYHAKSIIGIRNTKRECLKDIL